MQTGHQFKIRMPKSLHDFIVNEARNNNRSATAEIIERITGSNNGIPLRDHFAGLAMQATVSSRDQYLTVCMDRPVGMEVNEAIAVEAYSIADAMMKAREASHD